MREASKRWAAHAWPTLLVVEEDRSAGTLADPLAAHDIHVEHFDSAASALLSIGRQCPDAALVPLAMAEVSCLAWVRAVRAVCDLPLLVGVDVGRDALAGPALMAGATAVLSRPYDPALLATHLVQLWRSSPNRHRTPPQMRVGPLEIDVPAFSARLDGREIRLSLREFELLTCLMMHADRVVSVREIGEWLWGARPDAPSLDAIKTHVQRLRLHFGDPEVVRTVRGHGYTVHHLATAHPTPHPHLERAEGAR